MANKFVAVFLMCIVVVAVFSIPAAADCYQECYDGCIAKPDHSALYCDSSCGADCAEYPGAGRFINE